jgi:hypothetical protein
MDYYILLVGLDEEPQINFMNYVWDCLQHTLARDEFELIQYLDVYSQDEIFNAILNILDDEFSAETDKPKS